MSEVNKELVRRHFEELFNSRKLGVCDEVIARDFVSTGWSLSSPTCA